MKVVFFMSLFFLLSLGCASYQQKPAKTDTCFDLESCHRSCYEYKNKKACRTIQYYK